MRLIIPFCAQILPYIVIVPALIAWFRGNELLRRSLILRGVTALLTSCLLGMGIGQSFPDVRPFVLMHTDPLFSQRASNGFPLWQTLIPATVGFVIMPYWRPGGYLCVAVALIAGWAAIAALVSSPLDAVGGFAIAIISALVARALIRRGEKKRHLYPQRNKGSARQDTDLPKSHGENGFAGAERDPNSSSVTISEFDSRTSLRYSDSSYLRN